MGDGIRPKGSKSYAATRSTEAMEAFQKDQFGLSDSEARELVKKFWAKCAEVRPDLLDEPLTDFEADEIVQRTKDRMSDDKGEK